MTKTTAAFVALFVAAALPAIAKDTSPVPKMFRSMQKGQWKVDILESSAATKAGRMMPSMNVCTDNLMHQATSGPGPRAETKCKQRLLKDTADQAVMESICPERTSTVTIKRESAKVMLMEMKSSGPRGPQAMKMRYTYLGACSEGQGAVTFDKNSAQCVQMRAQAAKMDPAKSCAGSGDQRKECEQRMRDMIEKMTAACR
jgi:hypothetical protein